MYICKYCHKVMKIQSLIVTKCVILKQVFYLNNIFSQIKIKIIINTLIIILFSTNK